MSVQSATSRYRTQVSVRIDSHISGTIDVSRDCIALSTEKVTKAAGRFQIVLLARANYLNLVFPDDVVNIYVDPGDGETGPTRLMFGFVDRIDRHEVVDAHGAMNTQYTIAGSDFQKAVDRTCIYFNDFMRQILDKRFFTTLEGQQRPSGGGSMGQVLREAGISAQGTPADFVLNFLEILTGYGQQWKFPKSYAQAMDALQPAQYQRNTRIQRARSRVPKNILEKMERTGAISDDEMTRINNVLKWALDKKVKSEDAINAGVNLTKPEKEEYDLSLDITSSAALFAYRMTMLSTDDDTPVGLVDSLSFDFVEAKTIDGYNSMSPVWPSGSQTLGQYLYGHSNEFVNELIFDLRPVTENGLTDGDYSKEPDEIGGNLGSVNGVKYVPAVVFREYPWSTITRMRVKGTLDIPDDIAASLNFTDVLFGPVFVKGVNTTGRHTYEYPTPVSPSLANMAGDPVKHIDSVTIRNTDVVESRVGRSDDDTFNVHTLMGRGVGDSIELYRSWMHNYQPLINQVSVQRHGLRARETPTEFNSYYGTALVEGRHARRNLVRWQLLLDHWYQHNIEYLTGTIMLRGMPNIRVGYRLDWEDRHESYYVESVQHQWQYGQPLRTVVAVTRGQRNDPFPCYIPPMFFGADGSDINKYAGGNRFDTGRLAKFFPVIDTRATTFAIDNDSYVASLDHPNDVDLYPDAAAGGRAIFPQDAAGMYPNPTNEGDTYVDAGDVQRMLTVRQQIEAGAGLKLTNGVPQTGADKTLDANLRLNYPELFDSDTKFPKGNI